METTTKIVRENFRTIVSVVFTREEDAFHQTDEVEVLFEAHLRSNGLQVTYALEFKSATLMTDRVPVNLTLEEKRYTFEAACDCLEASDPDY